MFVVGQNLNSASSTVHQALAAGARAWVESSVRAQIAAGVDAIDCCAATFGAAEADVLRWLVEIVEAVGDVPVALDSPHPRVLVAVSERRRLPPLLNSLDADGVWPPPLLDRVRAGGATLVVQLRTSYGAVPGALDDRLEWTDRAVGALSRESIGFDRVWLDPVLLPWADDVAAGASLLGYLQTAPSRWPGLRTLVGLSNVSYGAAERGRLHRQWLPRLRDAGLAGVILDPLQPGLRALLPPGTS